MTNQSPIFNDQFEREYKIIGTIIKKKELEQQEILGCFTHIHVELNE